MNKLFCMFIGVFLLSVNISSAVEKESSTRYIFRGIELGSPKLEKMSCREIEPSSYIGTDPNKILVETCRMKDDDKKIGDIELNWIFYTYLDGFLYEIEFESGVVTGGTLDKLLIMKFGKAYTSAKLKKYTTYDNDVRQSKTAVIPNHNLIIHIDSGFSNTRVLFTDSKLKKVFDKVKEKERLFRENEDQNKKKKALKDF